MKIQLIDSITMTQKFIIWICIFFQELCTHVFYIGFHNGFEKFWSWVFKGTYVARFAGDSK